MFLLGLLGLAAVGGAAYAMSDILAPQEEDDEDVIQEDAVDDVSEGNLLEIDDSVDTPEPDLPTGTIHSNFEGNLVLVGSSQDDLLAGADGNDQINGYQGADTIEGGAGNDVLYGGDDADLLAGGEDDDVLHGEAGDDTLTGGTGDDQLFGHFGADVMDGGPGSDALNGGQGDDDMSGGEGDDSLQGGKGEDTLIGGAGKDALFGGDGNDLVDGSTDETDTDSDFLNGGAGDDTIIAGAGDVVTGGLGADQIAVDGSEPQKEVTVMDFTPGQDKLVISWEAPTDPDITIEPDSENTDLTHVLVNGSEVAQLMGADGLTLDDIELITGAGQPGVPG